jgi:hypothetical protein
LVAVGIVAGPQQAKQPTHLAQGLATGALDRQQQLLHSVQIGAEDLPGGTGLEHHRAQGMGEDVMELPRHPGPLLGHRRPRPLIPFPLQRGRSLLQGQRAKVTDAQQLTGVEANRKDHKGPGSIRRAQISGPHVGREHGDNHGRRHGHHGNSPSPLGIGTDREHGDEQPQGCGEGHTTGVALGWPGHGEADDDHGQNHKRGSATPQQRHRDGQDAQGLQELRSALGRGLPQGLVQPKDAEAERDQPVPQARERGSSRGQSRLHGPSLTRLHTAVIGLREEFCARSSSGMNPDSPHSGRRNHHRRRRQRHHPGLASS